MPKFLTLHEETDVDRVRLESRWKEIAMDARADWRVTLFNLAVGKRFCEWDAPDRTVLEEIFKDLGIKWTEIIEVESTEYSEWRRWELESGKRGLNR